MVSGAQAVRKKKLEALAAKRAKEQKLKGVATPETPMAGQTSAGQTSTPAFEAGQESATQSPRTSPGPVFSNPTIEEQLASGQMKHGVGKSPTKVAAAAAAQGKRKAVSPGPPRVKQSSKRLRKSSAPRFSDAMAKENEGKVFEASLEPTQTIDTPAHLRGHHKLSAGHWFGEEEGQYSIDKNFFWPAWHLKVNDSCSDPSIAKELNTKSVLPRDRAVAHKMPDSDLHNSYMTYKALSNAYEMEFFQRQLARESAHSQKYAAMSIIEKEWRDKEAALSVELKEAKDAMKQLTEENKEMSLSLTALEGKVDALKRSEAEKIVEAQAQAVKEFKASAICKKDILALNGLLYADGYNDCALAGEELYSDKGVTKEALGFDPETKSFDEYLAKFQANEDISDIWVSEEEETGQVHNAEEANPANPSS